MTNLSSMIVPDPPSDSSPFQCRTCGCTDIALRAGTKDSRIILQLYCTTCGVSMEFSLEGGKKDG